MRIEGIAKFRFKPRRIDELQENDGIWESRAYEVVKVITLSGMDFENFTQDMVADRLFIEENAELCKAASGRGCLLVKGRRRKESVLVLPDGGCHVLAAAMYSPAEEEE